MRRLHAYLMLRGEASEWEVSVHRDLESLELAWTNRSETVIVGIAHVGFWRPSETDFELATSGLHGVLLLTGSALASLPPFHTKSLKMQLEVCGLEMFLALDGWGYNIDSSTVMLQSTGDSGSLGEKDFVQWDDHLFSDEYLKLGDWMKNMQSTNAALWMQGVSNNIRGELDYLRNENRLEDDLRECLGWERYCFYSGTRPSKDRILNTLRFSPPWLLRNSIEKLNLSVRSTNGLKAKGIETLRDLSTLGAEGVGALGNIGRKSINEISEQVLELFCNGPWRVLTQSAKVAISARFDILSRGDPPIRLHSDQTVDTPSSQKVVFEDACSLPELLEITLGKLKPGHRAMIEKRMGFVDDRRFTLEQVAEPLGITRERVRQIEQVAVRMASNMPAWQHVEARLEECIRGRTSPLGAVGLDILDPWFKGIDSCLLPFAFALKNFCGKRFHLYKIQGQKVITRLAKSDWVEACRKAERILRAQADSRVTLEASRASVEGLMPELSGELREAFWEINTEKAHFSGDDECADCDRVLVSFGADVESAVKVVLANADHPLHFKEIATLCGEYLDRKVEVRRAHSAAAEVAWQLGRGIFGIDKHILLSHSERKDVIALAEDIVDDGHSDRQWHAREIVEAIRDSDVDYGDRLTPYVISILLRNSSRLVYLNRLVWAASSKAQGPANRIDVKQAIVALVTDAGRPMTRDEIYDKLSKGRGLSSYFQIFQGDNLIRLGSGKWGLEDRDVPFTKYQIELIVDAITAQLTESQKGLHVSEVIQVLMERLELDLEDIEPQLVFDLSLGRGGTTLSRGQYLYLNEWHEPRRLTLTQALKEIYDRGIGSSFTTSEIEEQSLRLMGRAVPRGAVASYLGDLGAIYDVSSCTWSLPIDADNDPQENPSAL